MSADCLQGRKRSFSHGRLFEFNKYMQEADYMCVSTSGSLTSDRLVLNTNKLLFLSAALCVAVLQNETQLQYVYTWQRIDYLQ